MAEAGGAPLLVAWSRAGGRPPSDDERLRIDDDGAFEAMRTVGGARIGSFAGTLEGGVLAALREAVDACRAAGEQYLDTPRDGATETIGLGPDEEPGASMGSNATPDGPWGTLVGRLRSLADDVTAHPVAALELVADPTGARLVAAGDGTLDVDEASVAVRVVRLDAAGMPLGRWQGASTETGPSWATTGPGWSLALPSDHGLAAGAGEWLQVWVFVRVRDAGGERAGRLFVAVPGA